MHSNQEMNEFNLSTTIRFLRKYWKVLLIVFFASAVVTGAISLFFKNYYKAQVTLLPADTNSVTKSMMSQMDVADPLDFGTEKECEHVLELLQSGKLLSDVIAKFNLAKHYGIDATGEELDEKLGRKLYNNIRIKRTDNLGIKLTVWDTDPKIAADIANYFVERLTALRYEMKRLKMDSICFSIERSKNRITEEISLLMDSMNALAAQYKIYAPDPTAERFAQEKAKQIAAGNTAAIARLDEKFKALEEGGAKIDNIKEQLYFKRNTLRNWSEFLERAKIDAEAYVPVEFVVESAYPTYYKDKPKRKLIVLFSAICCTLLGAVVLIIRDKAKAV
ncbi:MAG: hypothetical protein LBR17_09800 [Bacteroidales bacterium]|jgi:uncharacterized protein involved in exopolysaccharide biosynthesis|nr:hypothetical protein [Bacteroidales bacterium]